MFLTLFLLWLAIGYGTYLFAALYDRWVLDNDSIYALDETLLGMAIMTFAGPISIHLTYKAIKECQ